MKSPVLARVAVVLLILMAMGLGPSLKIHTARADAKPQGVVLNEPPDNLGGVDIVFIVDNSDDMFWIRNDKQPSIKEELGSDPDRDAVTDPEPNKNPNRFGVIDEVLARLTYDNLYDNRKRVHRVGVVTFGDRAQTDLNLVELVVNSSPSRDQLLDQLRGDINKEDMNSTNPIEAYRLALKMFENPPPLTTPDPRPRAKAIILLTNGVPFLNEYKGLYGWKNGQRSQGLNPVFIDRYMRDLEAELSVLPRASAPRSTDGYHLWVTHFGENWNAVRGHWERIFGADHLRYVPTAQDISPVVNSILDTIYDDGGQVIEGDFFMPPYVGRVAFSVYGYGEIKDKFILTDDQGVQVTENDPRKAYWRDESSTIRRIELIDPAPGKWRYSTLGNLRVTVKFYPRYGEPELASPKPNTTHTVFTPLQPAIKLIAKDPDRQLKEHAVFAPDFRAILVSPQGQEIWRGQLKSGDDSLYRPPEAVLPEQEGDYKLTLGAKFDASQYFTDGAAHVITVVPTTTLTIPVRGFKSRLELAGGAPAQPYRDALVRLVFLDSTGQQEAFPDPQIVSGRLSVTTPDGAQQETPLVYDPAGKHWQAPVFIGSQKAEAYKLQVDAWAKTRGGLQQDLFSTTDAGLLSGIPLELTKMSPAPSGQRPRGDSIAIGFALQCATNPFEPAKGDELLFDGSTLLSPDGKATAITPVYRLNGQWQYDVPESIDQVGTWAVRLRAALKRSSGEMIDGVIERDWAFEAVDATRVLLKVERPVSGEQVQLREKPPVPFWPVKPADATPRFVARLYGQAGSGAQAAISMDNLTTGTVDPAEMIKIALEGPDRDYSSAIEVSLDPLDHSQLVLESLEILPPGGYTLSVEANPAAEAKFRDLHFWAKDAKAKAAFQVVDPWTDNAPWRLGTGLGLLAVVLGLLATSRYLHAVPIKGTLTVEPGAAWSTFAPSGPGSPVGAATGAFLEPWKKLINHSTRFLTLRPLDTYRKTFGITQLRLAANKGAPLTVTVRTSRTSETKPVMANLSVPFLGGSISVRWEGPQAPGYAPGGASMPGSAGGLGQPFVPPGGSGGLGAAPAPRQGPPMPPPPSSRGGAPRQPPLSKGR